MSNTPTMCPLCAEPALKPRRHEHARHIKFGSFEHQQREIYAKHIHYDGYSTWNYGDGAVVMKVIKSYGREPVVDVLGEDGFNVFGEPFSYEDYFFPEELV